MNNLRKLFDVIEAHDRIMHVISDTLGVDRSKILYKSRLIDLGADIVDIIEIEITIEEMLGIMLGNNNWDEYVTVGQFIDTVRFEVK